MQFARRLAQSKISIDAAAVQWHRCWMIGSGSDNDVECRQTGMRYITEPRRLIQLAPKLIADLLLML